MSNAITGHHSDTEEIHVEMTMNRVTIEVAE